MKLYHLFLFSENPTIEPYSELVNSVHVLISCSSNKFCNIITPSIPRNPKRSHEVSRRKLCMYCSVPVVLHSPHSIFLDLFKMVVSSKTENY
jgi:hypothetical protein